MSKDFILPDIGEGIVECELVEWLVQEGDHIKEDQPVCDVMTDKALVQIPAVEDGVVTKLYYKQGEIAKVHQPLFAVASHAEQGSEATPTQGVTEQVMDHSPALAAAQQVGGISEDFLLPDIGEGIVECELVEWLVAEGDEVKEDQPICDVMTDKALVQIPAKNDGVITKLYYQKGDIAKVHAPLFAITSADAVAKQPVVAATVQAQPTSDQKTAVAQVTQASGHKAVASPAVRRLAREMGIDITQVTGSGEKGRVYKQDLIAHQSGSQSSGAQTRTPDLTVTAPSVGGTRVEPIKGIKAAMARAMTESVSTIPHFTYSDEIDITDLVALRNTLKADFAEQQIKLTMMPFFIKALSLALKAYPILNSQVNDDCTELRYFDDHNIGLAVDSKVGLLVPNVKQCQNKSIKQIAEELMTLTDQAREGRLTQEQLKSGTISISNIGAIGGTTATPIINKPEVAIVALGKVQSLPRFAADGSVQARQIMQVSWSGDHRVIDGATMARFNNLWMSYLQNPVKMLTELS